MPQLFTLLDIPIDESYFGHNHRPVLFLCLAAAALLAMVGVFLHQRKKDKQS